LLTFLLEQCINTKFLLTVSKNRDSNQQDLESTLWWTQISVTALHIVQKKRVSAEKHKSQNYDSFIKYGLSTSASQKNCMGCAHSQHFLTKRFKARYACILQITADEQSIPQITPDYPKTRWPQITSYRRLL